MQIQEDFSAKALIVDFIKAFNLKEIEPQPAHIRSSLLAVEAQTDLAEQAEEHLREKNSTQICRYRKKSGASYINSPIGRALTVPSGL